MADSFIELHKAVIHVIILVSFLCGHGIAVLVSTVGSLMDEDKRLVQSFLMGGTGYVCVCWGGDKQTTTTTTTKTVLCSSFQDHAQ